MQKIFPNKVGHYQRKSISFDKEISMSTPDKNEKNNAFNPDTIPSKRKSKFNIYQKSLKKAKQIPEEEKKNNALSLLNIIKTLKKASNLFKSRAGLEPVQQMNEEEVKFMHDLSYFPEVFNRQKFLKRYTEKNVCFFFSKLYSL